MANNFDGHIPIDNVTEILLRLPVKSLLQCKSVCKTWLSIISSRNFIKSQLHHAMLVSRINPTLLGTTTRVHEVKILPRARSSANNFDRLVVPRLFRKFSDVINSYNGIICVADFGYNGDSFYLWNPSIRMCRKLPHPPCMGNRYMIGFGYDSISNDYKVVRVVSADKDPRDRRAKVHVYSTNADCWTEFRFTIFKEYKRLERNHIVVNGVMYIDNDYELISFDLHKEVLGRVPLPGSWREEMSDLLDFEGSVAILLGYVGSEPGTHLWTLDDVSDPVSWTKRFSIDVDSHSHSHIWLNSYLGYGQFYGTMSNMKTYCFNNILYDYEKKETKLYEIDREDFRSVTGIKYIETLVSLDGFEQVE